MRHIQCALTKSSGAGGGRDGEVMRRALDVEPGGGGARCVWELDTVDRLEEGEDILPAAWRCFGLPSLRPGWS